MQATEPDLDGTITIEAANGTTAYVPLRLYASGSTPQPFTASFPGDTTLAFNVVPHKGMLPPAPKPGEPEPEPALQVGVVRLAAVCRWPSGCMANQTEGA